MVTFAPNDIWVNTPHGEGLLLYVENQYLGNDIWTVVILSTGKIRHYDITHVTMMTIHNKEINLKNNLPTFPADK